MDIVPLGPGFAAELRGVTLADVASQGTGSHFVILSTIGPDGKVVLPDHRLALRSKANQLWHTDSSFKRVPALTSILSARVIPAQGGETEYVSTRLAFERTDACFAKRLRQFLVSAHPAGSPIDI